MTNTPEPLPAPLPISALKLPGALSSALQGAGPAVQISPGGTGLIQAPPGVALVIGTSGSTGTPKQVMLGAAALRASSQGTAAALGGQGQWLLALPIGYIAGAQVLIRSIFAGTEPVVMPGLLRDSETATSASPFNSAAFTDAAATMTGQRRFTALVPTQLLRLLDDSAACAALRNFDAVLLGGAPAEDGLLARAQAESIRVVRTYGSAETCGGCLYDGLPLAGVHWQIRTDSSGNPRIWLGGATIAEGYLNDPARNTADFETREGTRWYRTQDLGEPGPDGRLRVLGRADDMVISGGLKISAMAVAQKLQTLDGVHEALVAGVPDREWGQRLVAAITLDSGPPAPQASSELAARLRKQASEVLAPHEVPKDYLFLAGIPLLPNGKPDRRKVLDKLYYEFAADSPPLTGDTHR